MLVFDLKRLFLRIFISWYKIIYEIFYLVLFSLFFLFIVFLFLFQNLFQFNYSWLHFFMKLFLYLFNFFTKWHLCCIEYFISSFLSRSWSWVSQVSKRFWILLLRIKCLKYTLIYLSLLLLSLLSFLNL